MPHQAFNIRPAVAADAAAIQAIYAPFVTDTVISFEEVPPTVDEMAARIANAQAGGYAFLAAAEGDAILGYAYAGAHRTRPAYRASVDVSAYVAPGAHRRGIGRRLYEHLLQDLTAKDFHAAFAGITQPNAASVGLHEALGFTHVGTYCEVGFKFGAWHDVGWWQRLL
ncbi:MAG: arsinothricin resistance N-acetyltransferase ArsN1 family B [Hyphomicrobiaceae bacterium]